MQLTKNRYSPIPVILLLFSLVLTSCLDSSDSDQTVGNLFEEADRISDFNTFVDYLGDTGAAELDSTIAQGSQMTVIIPTNDAFDDLPSNLTDTLSSEEARIEVLSYHILNELVEPNNLEETEDIQSMQGEYLYFELVSTNQGTSLNINDSELLQGGILSASNGYIYAVDQVLFPDSYLDVTGLIAKRYQLNDLQDAIEDVAGLEEDLQNPNGEFTVFAPSDEALDGTSPTGNEIQYYILEEKLTSAEFSSQTYTTMSGDELDVDVSGATITINGEATVTTADIEGINGVVHIIDTPLEAPSEE
ncbi:Uncaracterized surface protein containing fasciclin (FAS1) repeats [Fodinibius roseus]|uniref:Uncaracterized surface protein containing fasciclin (FAS1) repeats n=1 Tax=Fodinibius roseus TaxID=1194090 RepID=A0A1M5GVK0_9BACT|nr:fasciclin domain-containing protein [Fodinibius roseus]SHG07786.1 Uncaracterized surface protein containing fasciclin (FAS1) repeats [Fodinibius roseus]